MTEVKKYLLPIVFGALYSILTWWVSTIWKATDTNTDYSIKHSGDIKNINLKIEGIEKNMERMPDVYVTRRELEIRLQNIDTKIDNIKNDVNNVGADVKNIDSKFDKLFEKIYEK